MFGILQRYIARELVKTFVLAAIGLTLTFTLCGGVLNMIRAEVLTAVQLARILGFVLPISLTLTLPISALFACAIVYGRLAADNEFDACKASGINIHRLLGPAFGLSLFTALFTYTFTNHLIPSFIEQLDELVRKDIQKIVYSALNNHGYLKFREYVLYAGATELDEKNADLKTIRIQNAAFLNIENDKLSYCGTADHAEIAFTRDAAEGAPVIGAALFGIRSLDMSRHRFMELEEQALLPEQLPQKARLELKFMTLPDLIRYSREPLKLPTIEDNLAKVNALVREAQFYKHVADQLTGPARNLKLSDDRVSYEISAEGIERDRQNLRPTLHTVTVKEKDADGRRRTYKAERCGISLSGRPGLAGGQVAVLLSLKGNVSMVDASAPAAAVTNRNRWELDRVMVPDSLPGVPPPVDQMALLGDVGDPASLDNSLTSLQLGERIDSERESSRKSIVKVALQIAGIIHSRLAFSVSTLVLLVLAAGLGIIYRGGQLLTAFVISFLPGMVMVVMNIMGRQLTENLGTHILGISIIWGGIALLAVADVVILARFLKR